MSDFIEAASEEKSAFNMGVPTLKRIDRYLSETEVYRTTNDFVLWYKKLKSVMYELIPFLTEPQLKSCDEHEKKCDELINVFNLSKVTANVKQIGIELASFERFLRIHLHKHSLLMPTKSDPRYALLGG